MSGELNWPTVTGVILQVPNPAGSIPGGFSFVQVEVTSEEMPASAFTADAARYLGAALGAALAERPDPERYGPWLEFYRVPEVPDGG